MYDCTSALISSYFHPKKKYILSVSNRDTIKRYEMYSKLTKKKQKKNDVNDVVLLSLLLTLKDFTIFHCFCSNSEQLSVQSLPLTVRNINIKSIQNGSFWGCSRAGERGVLLLPNGVKQTVGVYWLLIHIYTYKLGLK